MPSPAYTAFADQFNAASREAGDLLIQTGALCRAPVGAIIGPDWIRTQAEALTDSILTGTVKVCPHVTDSPSVLLAAAWAPGRLVCPACTHTVKPDDQAEEGTCDRCRRHVGATHACMIALGPVLFTYGLCTECYRHVHPETTPAVTGPTTTPRPSNRSRPGRAPAATRRAARRSQRAARRATRNR